MCNVERFDTDLYSFQIWNLNCKEISGHWTIFLNWKTKEYLIAKHGDFAGLTSYVKIEEMPRFPTAEEKNVIDNLRYNPTWVMENAGTYEEHIKTGKYFSNHMSTELLPYTDLQKEQYKVAKSLLIK